MCTSTSLLVLLLFDQLEPRSSAKAEGPPHSLVGNSFGFSWSSALVRNKPQTPAVIPESVVDVCTHVWVDGCRVCSVPSWTADGWGRSLVWPWPSPAPSSCLAGVLAAQAPHWPSPGATAGRRLHLRPRASVSLNTQDVHVIDWEFPFHRYSPPGRNTEIKGAHSLQLCSRGCHGGDSWCGEGPELLLLHLGPDEHQERPMFKLFW